MSHVGYLGVVVPAEKHWQGYFIDDMFAEAGHNMLATARSDPRLRSQVITKLEDDKISVMVHDMLALLGGDPALRAKVSTRLNIDDADQPILGSLCATIAEAAMGRLDHPDAVIGACGYAIYEMINRKYFWIEAKRDENGTATTITPIYVSSINEARDTINALPIVRKIKRRLMEGIGALEGMNRVSGAYKH